MVRNPHRRQHDGGHQRCRPDKGSGLPHLKHAVFQHKTGDHGKERGEQQTFGFQHRQHISPSPAKPKQR
ncbi:hypothetical protein D3C87_1885500 [compost metagenome]